MTPSQLFSDPALTMDSAKDGLTEQPANIGPVFADNKTFEHVRLGSDDWRKALDECYALACEDGSVLDAQKFFSLIPRRFLFESCDKFTTYEQRLPCLTGADSGGSSGRRQYLMQVR